MVVITEDLNLKFDTNILPTKNNCIPSKKKLKEACRANCIEEIKKHIIAKYGMGIGSMKGEITINSTVTINQIVVAKIKDVFQYLKLEKKC